MRRSPLWRHADFVRFWSAASVSLVGDGVTRLALPLIAIAILDATPLEVGVLGAVQLGPFLVVGLPAGAIIDRIERVLRLMVFADVARATLLLSVPVAYAAGVLSLVHLYVVAFATGVLTVFFDTASSSYLPSLLERQLLVDGNSKLEASRSAAQIAGPGLAGALIELTSAPVALVADALSFLTSGALIARIRQPTRVGDVRTQVPPNSSLRREVVEGARFLIRHPYLRAIALTTTAANFFRSALLAVVLVYLVREAGASAGAIGLAFAVGNVGFLLAVLVAPAAARRFGIGPTMRAAVSCFGPAAVLVAASPARWAVVAVAVMEFVDSFGIGLHGVNQVSLRQAVTPEHLRGRVAATLRLGMFGGIPLGTLLGGALATLVGLQPALWVAAAGMFLAAVPYAVSSTGRLAALPEPATS
jgi:MFS family permease